MSTFVKYLIYIALVVVAFLFLVSLWETGQDNRMEVVEVGVVTPETQNQPQTNQQPAQ